MPTDPMWEEYEKFISRMNNLSITNGQSNGQWQTFLGEMIEDMQVRARSASMLAKEPTAAKERRIKRGK